MSITLDIKTLRLTVAAAAIVLPTVSHAVSVSCAKSSYYDVATCTTANLYIPGGKRLYLSASAIDGETYETGATDGRVTLFRNNVQLYERRFNGSHSYNYAYNNSGTYKAVVNSYRTWGIITNATGKLRY